MTGGLLIPATQTRSILFSRASYYIQHLLLSTAPLFYLTAYPDLIYQTKVLATRDAMVLKISMSITTLWISWMTMANINLSLCPDPLPDFSRFYRLYLMAAMPFLHVLTWLLFTRMAWVLRPSKPKRSCWSRHLLIEKYPWLKIPQEPSRESLYLLFRAFHITFITGSSKLHDNSTSLLNRSYEQILLKALIQ